MTSSLACRYQVVKRMKDFQCGGLANQPLLDTFDEPLYVQFPTLIKCWFAQSNHVVLLMHPKR